MQAIDTPLLLRYNIVYTIFERSILMGTFARQFEGRGAKIPECKVKEFTERVEKLFQAGGMMEVEYVQLRGKRIAMLRKAQMRQGKMNFYYNYFEDDCWENAGFGAGVWSGKIGWSSFHRAVVAAYVLEELYLDNVSVALVDGEPVTSWGYVAWINYLFNEKFFIKNYDPWKLFEEYHYLEDEREEYVDWLDFGKERCGFIGTCEVYAVKNSTEKAIKFFDGREKGETEEFAFDFMKDTIAALKQYEKDSDFDRDTQLKDLMSAIQLFYEQDFYSNPFSSVDKKFKRIIKCLYLCDAPAFVIKAISEIYGKEFWELWEQMEGSAKRRFSDLYGNDRYYVVPIATEKFFKQLPDDMIPYWEENGDIVLSEELWDWFSSLKEKFNIMIKTDFSIEKPLEYILELMQEADEEYYRIYTFSDFFEETLENLKDKRFLTLWKLYEEMLRDPELKKAGDVIFVPDGPGHENEGLHYWGEQPKRRLMREWCMTPLDKQNNIARVTFRRYMALVANKALRAKVFGF